MIEIAPFFPEYAVRMKASGEIPMQLSDYVHEAAAALEPPVRVRPLLKNIRYDHHAQEWYIACHDAVLASFPLDIKLWVHRLIGWLQYRFPRGPAWSAASGRRSA
jgi:hypothetical protein